MSELVDEVGAPEEAIEPYIRIMEQRLVYKINQIQSLDKTFWSTYGIPEGLVAALQKLARMFFHNSQISSLKFVQPQFVSFFFCQSRFSFIKYFICRFF
jgi:hypothetical protein